MLDDGGDRSGAIACFERVVALRPRMADAHARLGTLLNLAGQRDLAITHLRRAAAAEPNTTLGRVSRARAFLLEDNLAEAEQGFSRAVALDPKAAEARRMLGAVFSIRGRFDEASDQFMRALEVDRDDVIAYFGLARSRRMTEADRPLIERMRARADAVGLSAQQRTTLHFALGKGLEDLGDWAGAWERFEAANRLRAQAGKLDRAACAARVDRIIDTFGAGAFETPRPPVSSNKTPIFVLGMPRSGTTLVEQIVSSHPLVAGGGELRFWTARGAAWETAGGGVPGHDAAEAMGRAYSDILQSLASGESYVTDKNPFNFFWIGLIMLAFPHAIILHCRRNPIDTCLSIYKTQFSAPLDFASDQHDLAFFHKQYERLMAHWRSVLDRSRFRDIDYETLVSGGEPAIRNLIESCGLPWSDRCLHPENNPRPVRTASLWQARQPIYGDAVARWHHYKPWLNPLITLLDQSSPNRR